MIFQMCESILKHIPLWMSAVVDAMIVFYKGVLQGSAKGVLQGSAKGVLQGSAKGALQGRFA